MTAGDEMLSFYVTKCRNFRECTFAIKCFKLDGVTDDSHHTEFTLTNH